MLCIGAVTEHRVNRRPTTNSWSSARTPRTPGDRCTRSISTQGLCGSGAGAAGAASVSAIGEKGGGGVVAGWGLLACQKQAKQKSGRTGDGGSAWPGWRRCRGGCRLGGRAEGITRVLYLSASRIKCAQLEALARGSSERRWGGRAALARVSRACALGIGNIGFLISRQAGDCRDNTPTNTSRGSY